jgi:hypothetical protein
MKPRSDAKLLNLPEEQQAQLAEWLLTGMPLHGVKSMVEKEWSICTSLGALSHFYSSVCSAELIARRKRAVSTADQIAEQASKTPGRFDAATIDALKQKAFELSINPRSAPGEVKALFMLVLKARDQEISERQLALDHDRFEVQVCEKFLAWFSDSKAREIAESQVGNGEKIAALRKAYFADVDELEKSGKVALPK